MQVNNSDSAEAGTLRGMHYQLGDDAETKLVRCIKGSLWDCIIDLRPDSPTFKKWYGVELSAENRLMLAVPRGFAHGFITLEPGTEAFYFVDNFYAPDAERGIRHDDPEFGIEWPREPAVQSDKDKSWRDFDPSLALGLNERRAASILPRGHSIGRHLASSRVLPRARIRTWPARRQRWKRT